MDTIKKLEIDLVNPPAKIPTIYLVQGDYYTRKIRATLLANDTPWNIPSDAIIGLRYRKPDGTAGSYDSLPDGTAAYSISENTVTFTLAPQVVSAEGCVNAQLEIVSGNEILASFVFQILVAHDPSRPIYNSLNYFNWQQWAEAQLDQRMEEAKAAGFFMPSFAIGTVETLSPGSDATVAVRGTGANPILDFGIPAGESGLLDDTLSLPGYAADAQAAGTAIKHIPSIVNLLDNSDFTNPVNQRGQSDYSGYGYTIDRWILPNASDALTVNENYVTVSGAVIQRLERHKAGAEYTLACQKIDGTIVTLSGSFESGASNGSFSMNIGASSGRPYIQLKGGDYVWVALYEGVFDTSTLPGYRPKGFASELAECQRYYAVFGGHFIPLINTANAPGFYCYRLTVSFPVMMRTKPTITIGAVSDQSYKSPEAVCSDNRCVLLYYNGSNSTSIVQCKSFAASADL